MPIFQADLELLLEGQAHDAPSEPSPATAGQARQSRPATSFLHPNLEQPALLRKLSEESIRTELCEGPVPDSPRPATEDADLEASTSNRAELIERLKRGESPTWIPARRLESLYDGPPPPRQTRSPRPPADTSSLLPPADITPEKLKDVIAVDEEARLRDGLNIQRPRSALHSGDFTQIHAHAHPLRDSEDRTGPAPLQAPTHSWIATSPPRGYSPFDLNQGLSVPRNDDYQSIPSSLSSSFSSNFAYRPPTSPLVQSESNDEFDLVQPIRSMSSASTPASLRRHTLTSSPSPFALPPRSAHLGGSFSHKRESSLPYQAHQPRRSLTSTPNTPCLGPSPSPQTPAFLRSRRPSFSDASPLQHASMVGSYEESILRGRMSTNPSKPLDFLAQIGVLGLGKCKPSLKCPSHVTLPFPAVFYSYGSSAVTGRSPMEDGPSPYVGQIDLENGLPSHGGEDRTKKKMHSRYADRQAAGQEIGSPTISTEALDRESHKASRARRRSGSPRAPPGGSYRVPEKGQIQIVIKNPNKTAVKLFLVPYDLAGMEPGTKTFIRQRSYSAGPIIENAPDDPAANRSILRYLVHLHFCCPSKGRFYLYKSIRIVFANRVPDGKEKLRNETTWPEPKFSTYKPIRVMNPPLSSTGPGAMLAAEKAFRRRSSGFSFGPSVQAFDAMDGVMHSRAPAQHSSPSLFSFGGNTQPVDPIPLRLPSRNRLGSDVSDSTDTTGLTGLRSPGSSQTSRPTTKDGLDAQIARYEKLNKGDVGYGGNAFAGLGRGSPSGTEGLLSQRLRSLGVQGQGSPPPDDMD
ncbi:hypothetical protein HYQ45_006942 [Verticillium longisporum]|uniref:Atos-like conserved domain-containing protein n=2 Tax=Verticillium longisporum TaxID=100787 RepID=A0A8I3AS77_VERLO|nr:hypothetical protein HYQ45_006942 [Verticillium longisporum]